METQTTDATVLSLRDMQLTPASELRAIAKHSANRFYATAASQMAHAMEAHALGDATARNAHVGRARAAYEAFTTDLEAQELAAKVRIAELRAEGLAQAVETGRHNGIGAHISLLESSRYARHAANRAMSGR